MARTLAVAILSWAMVCTPANAQPRAIENPVWLAEPNGEDFREHYPDAAVAQAVEGSATIECFVRLDTRTDCRVTAESPEGWGFGDAAIRISEAFRVQPARRSGRPVEGGRIRRTIRFILPEDYNRPSPEWAPEVRQVFELNPAPELPKWDEAPNYFAVLDAYPAEPRRQRMDGRGVLSCTVNTERRLNCSLIAEMPAGQGFGAAALQLAPDFRISTNDAAFVERHRTEPFLLPINFVQTVEELPVNRFLTGLHPIRFPPLFAPPAFVDADRPAGRVTVLCTVQNAPPADCVVEQEIPENGGYGELMAPLLRLMPLEPGHGIIAGDQIRFDIVFAPPA